MKNLFIEVGNTRIKLVLLNENDTIDSKTRSNAINHSEGKDWGNAIIDYMDSAEQMIISGVEPNIIQVIEQMAKQKKKVYTRISQEDTHSIIDTRKVPTMGIDRIMGCVAASINSNKAFITIDCGTALTCNLVDDKRICIGGIIAPGAVTMKKSLAMNTALLPEVVAHHMPNQLSVGQTTEDAIQQGVLHAIVGCVNQCINTSQKILDTDFDIIITGGYGKILHEIMENKVSCTYNQNLTLIGMQHIWNKNFNKN